MGLDVDSIIAACFESGNIFSDECNIIRARFKELDDKDNIIISRQTAITSITGLRQFNKKLEEDMEKYGRDPNYLSSYHSVLDFREYVRKAYKELQDKTGDKTPIDLRSWKNGRKTT